MYIANYFYKKVSELWYFIKKYDILNTVKEKIMANENLNSDAFKNLAEGLMKTADEWLTGYINNAVQSAIQANQPAGKTAYQACVEYRRYPYCSQVGQDRYLNEYIFKDKKNGFFVDIGAHDGYTLSNSYFFEDKRGWDGICVEPMPNVFKQLAQKRKCKCINAAVSKTYGEVEFLIDKNFDMLSCIYDEKDKGKIESGEAEIIKVPSIPMDEILKDINHPIDFISIDTEGYELEVLESIDLERFDIEAFTIENNSKEGHLRDYLIPRGYKYITTIGDLDEIFVKNRD